MILVCPVCAAVELEKSSGNGIFSFVSALLTRAITPIINESNVIYILKSYVQTKIWNYKNR